MRLFLLLFLTGCSSVFYFPTRALYSDPAENALQFENHYIDSDGYRLHSWYFKTTSEKPKGLVVLFHGNAQNLTSHYMNLVWLVKEGYDFFIFDYRGYGLNPGLPSQAGLYRDGLAAIEYADKLREKRNIPKLILYGQSLGGAVLARSMVDSKVEASAVVFDSTFHSYQQIAASKLTYVLSFLGYVLVSDEYASTKFLPNITTKAFVIHGDKDRVVPKMFGEEIYQMLGSKQKEVFIVKGSDHIDSYHNPFTQKIAREKLLSFLAGI